MKHSKTPWTLFHSTTGMWPTIQIESDGYEVARIQLSQNGWSDEQRKADAELIITAVEFYLEHQKKIADCKLCHDLAEPCAAHK